MDVELLISNEPEKIQEVKKIQKVENFAYLNERAILGKYGEGFYSNNVFTPNRFIDTSETSLADQLWKYEEIENCEKTSLDLT